MDYCKEIQNYGVSRETFLKIEDFVSLLLEWNKKMNLVSKNAVNEIWERHVLDCVQLYRYLPTKNFSLLDVGSGSGFPGIILGIMLQNSENVKITLVESINKKSVYLNAVVQELKLKNVFVCNGRVENGVFKTPDFITARAVAALPKLLEYTAKIIRPETVLLLLKGRTYNDEINDAGKNWNFRTEVYPDKYGTDGVVLKITDIRKLK